MSRISPSLHFHAHIPFSLQSPYFSPFASIRNVDARFLIRGPMIELCVSCDRCLGAYVRFCFNSVFVSARFHGPLTSFFGTFILTLIRLHKSSKDGCPAKGHVEDNWDLHLGKRPPGSSHHQFQ